MPVNCATDTEIFGRAQIRDSSAWLRMADQPCIQFVVLFTAQKLKKSKTWQDGEYRLSITGMSELKW